MHLVHTRSAVAIGVGAAGGGGPSPGAERGLFTPGLRLVYVWFTPGPRTQAESALQEAEDLRQTLAAAEKRAAEAAREAARLRGLMEALAVEAEERHDALEQALAAERRRYDSKLQSTIMIIEIDGL